MSKRALFVLTLALASVGCRSQQSVRDAYDERDGTAREYPVPAAVAYKAAIDVLEAEGVDELQEFPDKSHAVGGFGASGLSWGAWVGVWIDPVGTQRSKVTVVTKRKFVLNAATALTETTFHEELSERLPRANLHAPSRPPEP